MTKLEYERVRDFIILHYKLTKREDSALWNDCQHMAIPETLEQKIRLFKARGHFVKYRWEIFQPASWLALYSGFGILPETYDPAADNLAIDYLKDSLSKMRGSVYNAAMAAPRHSDFLNRNFQTKF